MEVLAAQAETNPNWTMQGLLALCRKISCLEDEPQNADYFDGVYLVLAELFEQFQQTGGLSGPPEALRRVRSFTLDVEDEPQNADYFDGVYLVLAELFEQFQQTGGLSGPPEALRRVRSFTLDAASQQEVRKRCGGCAVLRWTQLLSGR